MQFRIGINLGDVMVEGSDIYGDGVNIAARLQEIAEPGGVVISGSVYDHVHNKLALGFDSLGQQPMKNVAPVTSYRVTMGGQAAGQGSIPVNERRPEAGAQRIGDRPEPSTGLHSALDWLASRPRSIAVPLIIAAFLILINVFTGLNRIWFHWPVAALLFIAILRTVTRRRTPRD